MERIDMLVLVSVPILHEKEVLTVLRSDNTADTALRVIG